MMLLLFHLLCILSLNCLCIEVHSNTLIPKVFNLVTRCCSQSAFKPLVIAAFQILLQFDLVLQNVFNMGASCEFLL